MEPGTAAILTLSAITGISGYGAMKLNAKRGALIDEEVKKAIGDAQAMIKSAQDAKAIAEEEVKALTAEIARMKQAQEQLKSEKAAVSQTLEEPKQPPEPVVEPEPEAESRSVELPEINACKETLSSLGIEDLSSYRKWIRDNQNDPRLPEVNNCADIVLKNRTGGMRKKKLRTRREGKQNVGRTRRSKNRANRSH
jgi:hypothetical protein